MVELIGFLAHLEEEYSLVRVFTAERQAELQTVSIIVGISSSMEERDERAVNPQAESTADQLSDLINLGQILEPPAFDELLLAAGEELVFAES